MDDPVVDAHPDKDEVILSKVSEPRTKVPYIWLAVLLTLVIIGVILGVLFFLRKRKYKKTQKANPKGGQVPKDGEEDKFSSIIVDPSVVVDQKDLSKAT